MSGGPAPEQSIQLGEQSFEQGLYAEALEHYDQALAAGAAPPSVLRRKADALLALGEYQAAVDCYDRILANEPGCPHRQG